MVNQSKSKFAFLLAMAAAICVVGGCSRTTTGVHKPSAAQKPAPPAPVETPVVEKPVMKGNLFTLIAPVNAEVRDAAIKPGLSNVRNLKIFTKLLDTGQRQLIAKNGFVVSPTRYIQAFQVYEDNAYARPKQIPNFITVDAMLHTYHVFYDFSLREIEAKKLHERLVALSTAMMKQSEVDYNDAKDPMVKTAAKGNVAYFAVALELLGMPATPAYVAAPVKADVRKMMAHKERDKSDVLSIGVEKPFVPVGIDFTQIVPRGHYTRSEQLKRYFRTMMWYGLASLGVPVEKDDSDLPTLRAVLIARNLNKVKTPKGSAADLWEGIYEPTAFYVGVSDDIVPAQYLKLSNEVYGKNPSLDAFGDKGKLAAFIKKAKQLPPPGILNFVATGPPKYKIATGLQMRFMGQRFIVDSRLFQAVTEPNVNQRFFPRGLDVFSAMGSRRADDIANKVYKTSAKFPDYPRQMAKARKEFAAIRLSTWQSNLYYGWLWSLWPLTQTFGSGYPAFMRNEAWMDKSLNTALGSWAELRHDTILYAKQSVSECGGDDEELELPKAYVEPNVELWSRLLWLTERTGQGLKKRQLMTENLTERFDWMVGWLKFLKDCSVKELNGIELTTEDYERLNYFGPALENQMNEFYGGTVITETDKNMAVIADVHTSSDRCLEEGVGKPAAIYVAVPIGGKLYLTRGAVFTYYEFVQPSSNRLTDEQWQKMLDSPKPIGPPEWTRSFFWPGKKVYGDPSISDPAGGGC